MSLLYGIGNDTVYGNSESNYLSGGGVMILCMAMKGMIILMEETALM